MDGVQLPPLRGGSLLFTIQFPEIPGTQCRSTMQADDTPHFLSDQPLPKKIYHDSPL